MDAFTYKSEQIHSMFKNGKGYTRRNLVDIQNGKGIKAIETYNVKGDRTSRKEKALTAKELACIQRKEFIPGLFQDCIKPLVTKAKPLVTKAKPLRGLRSKRSKTRRTRK